MSQKNRKTPYVRFSTDDLTLRDVLAVDRTVVANERTFLGYIRTTLALLAAGGSLLHFVDAMWSTVTGIALLGASVPMFAIGLHHYLARRRALAPLMCVVEDSDCIAEVPRGQVVRGEG